MSKPSPLSLPRRLGVIAVLVASGFAFWKSTQLAMEDAATAVAPQELRRGNGVEPDSLDPQLARMDSALTILRDAFEGLVVLGADGDIAPGAAASWEISEGGRHYVFHLRPEARWSSGDAVVAEDFAFAFRRLVDPATASQYALMLEPVANARDIVAGRKPVGALGVVARDAQTLVVQLDEPAPYFLAMLAHPATYPVHRATLAQSAGEFSRPGTVVTNGAYVPVEWQLGTEVVSRRNPHYRDAASVAIDTVRYLHVADPVMELTRFRAGDLDITYTIAPGELARSDQPWTQRARLSPQLGVYYYGFALDRPPFRDAPGLRRALAMSVDRELLVRQVLGDGEIAALSWVPPGTAGHTSARFDWANLTLAARLSQAQALYQAAGYSRERPLSFELRYNKSPLHDRIALAVAAMWQQALGVQLRLVAEDFRVLKQAIDAREVEMFRASWIGDYNDAHSFLQLLQGGFGINLPRYSSAAYDTALARARGAAPGERPALLAAAEQQLLNDTPLIPLFFYVSKHLVSERVVGWYDNVMNVTYSKDLSLVP